MVAGNVFLKLFVGSSEFYRKPYRRFHSICHLEMYELKLFEASTFTHIQFKQIRPKLQMFFYTKMMKLTHSL